MIGYKHPGITNRFRLRQNFIQARQEILSICLSSEYFSTLYPPNHDVVQHSGRVQACLSRHGAILHNLSATVNLSFYQRPPLHVPLFTGGALSEKQDQWLSSRQDLFVHTKPWAVLFKAKFRHAMKRARLFDKIDPGLWKQPWVVHSQAVGTGRNCLRYLSRYVFRVAISNNRIKSRENGVIKILYKDRRKKTWKTMALDPMEFIRRFLQHVLPKGLMKIRYYGFLNCNSSLSIDKIRELISFIHNIVCEISPEIPDCKNSEMICVCCGKTLKFIAFLKPPPRWGPSG